MRLGYRVHGMNVKPSVDHRDCFASPAMWSLSRKNALFAGHDAGVANWACLASLIETCKLNRVDPQAYRKRSLSPTLRRPSEMV